MRVVLCLLFSVLTVLAQGTVTIYGTVRDNSGAVVPGVEVTVTNTLTGAVRTLTSDETGGYIASQLPVGTYSVRAQIAGFKSFVQDDIRVQVDENRQVNITLEVGAVTESVEVKAELTQVETRSGAIREVVDTRRIVELPLNGRNPLQLQYLVAGSGGVTARDQAQNPAVSINGSRANSNNYQLDGGDNHDPYFNRPAVFPSPDALEEFSIQTNSYGADRGRNAGAFMAAVTRSGTNEFHGTLFEFLRNEKLNARNFFANDVPPFKRNQFGGTFGGRIIRDRTFFFGSYQRTAERSAPGAVTATVLTPEQRQGDFSALGRSLTDPNGGTFPNARIPANRLSQPAQRFLEAFIPLPNRPNGLLTTASQQTNDNDQIAVKGDHRISEKNQLSARLLWADDVFNEATGNLPGFLAAIKYNNWNGVITDTHIFTPALLSTFAFAYNQIDRKQLSVVPGDQSWQDFGAGFTRTFTAGAPVGMHTVVDGYFNAFSRFPLNHFRQNVQFGEMLSWNRGAHFLKFGGDYRRSWLDMQEFFRGDPWIQFRNTFTGNAAADLLLGLPTQYEQIAEAHNMPRTTELGLFLQDDWKASSRLTLNLGIRWDPWFPFTDKLNKFAQVRPGQQSTVFPSAPPGVVFVGDPDTTRSLLHQRLGNVAPRFGFAFDPTGSGRTSIRGGYGIFYSQVRQQANNQISTNQPFSLKLTVQRPAGGVADPYRGIGDPFPFEPPQTDAEKQAYRWVLPLTITQWNPNFRNAIQQQWNFNVQRQFFGSWMATAAYVGSKGNHLFMTAEANPGVPGAPGANLNARRPLAPFFGEVTDRSSRGNSIYHSMQLTLNKRFSQGLTLLTNYTWGKLIDDASEDGDSPANPFNFRHERGPSDFDITHRFVSSFIYQLPGFANAAGPVRAVIGGWELNGIVTLASGRWINFTSGRDNSGSGVNADRADLVGDPFLDTSRPRSELISAYYNKDAFAANAPGTFGNVGRNFMRGPGEINLDVGVVKNIPLKEAWRLQFRGEFFNATNRVNLGNPNTNVTSPQAGIITSAGAPRVVQLALKMIF